VALANQFLALAALWSGDVVAARALSEASGSALRNVAREDDVASFIRAARLSLCARLAWETGNAHSADRLATQLAQLARARDDRFWLAHALRVQALVADSAGAHDFSMWLIERAISLQPSFGSADALVDLLCERGQLELNGGNAAEALETFAEALRLADQTDLSLGVLWALEGIALSVQSARPADAVCLISACERIRDALGCRALPIEKQRVVLSLTRARNRLSQTEYQAARTAGRRLDRRQAQRLADTLLNRGSPDTASMFERLTAREREVADLIARGLSNSQIAHGLAVTLGTARTHVDHILAKLGMHSRAQVAVWAVASGGAHSLAHPSGG